MNVNEYEKAKNVPPFVRFCAANIPTVFDDTLSYYEALCALNNFIQKELVEVVNNNATYSQELDKKFNTLKEYTENYFTNLNVQNEINNKLDEMAQNGELQEIIGEFLRLNSLLVFNSVEDLKLSDNLIENSTAKTLGYYSNGDGGGGVYKIISIDNTIIIDNAKYIPITSSPNLVAELIFTDINLNQWGAKGDGIQDDTLQILNAINYASQNNLPIVCCPGKTFLISETLPFNNLNVNLNNSTIKTNNNIDLITINTTEYYGIIENAILDCSNSNSGIMVTVGRKKTFNNIIFNNINNYGFYFASGFEILLKDSHFNGNGTSSCTGIYCGSSDSKFENIILIDCTTAIVNRGMNFFEYVHAWIYRTNGVGAIVPNTICFSLDNNQAFFNQCYADSYDIAFNINGGSAFIEEAEVLYGAEANFPEAPYVFFYTDETADTLPNIVIQNSNIVGPGATKKVIFSNYQNKIKALNNRIFAITDYTTGIKSYTPTVNKEGVTITDEGCLEENGIMYIYILLTFNTEITRNATLSTIPTEKRPPRPIYSGCDVANSQYGAPVARGYLFSYGDIQITIPQTVTGTAYCRVMYSYPIDTEDN